MLSTTTPTMDPEIVGKKMPYAQLMNVTPELAKRWLADSNVKNRKLKHAHAARIARDICNGKWCITHQGIAFSTKGILLDGQHRLQAIVESGIAVQMFVWFDVDPVTLAAIDRNTIRTKCDAINLTSEGGRVTEPQVATLTTMLNGLGFPVELTSSEAQSAMNRHRNAIHFAHTHLPANCRARNVASRGTRAAIARAFYSSDHNRLAEFCKVLRTGVASRIDDQPAAILYQYLTQMARPTAREVRKQYARVETALLAFVRFEPVARLTGTRRELFPLPQETQR